MDRDRLATVMQHMGIGACDFFRFIERATARGEVSVTGTQGLSDVFITSRGI